VPGCPARAPHVAHAITCPRQNEPSPEDRLDNLRSLCAVFDAQSRNTRAAARLSKAAISTAGRSPPIFALNTPIAQLPAIPEPRPIGRKPTTNIAGGARSSRGTAGLPTSLTLWLKRGSSEVLKASIFDGYRLGPAHAAPSMTLSLPLRRVVDGYWRLSLEAV